VLDPVFDSHAREGFKAHTLLIEVEDNPGVLNEVTGVIARRGYNIQSLAVGNSERQGYSRITTVLPGQKGNINKLIKQIEKLVVVQEIKHLTEVPHVHRELMLAKVRQRLSHASAVRNGSRCASDVTQGKSMRRVLHVRKPR
jgi:acetolactate synthase I/III small subunit